MPDKKLKLGVLLPTRWLLMPDEKPHSMETVLSMAESVEQAGLDSVWVGDSLTAKPRLEPLTALTAVAMRTKHCLHGLDTRLNTATQPRRE